MLTGCEPHKTQATANPFDHVSNVTLPNGLQVYFYENHASPVITVHFWCRTGSRNEPEKYAGISHFFEHMFFKGSKHYGVGQMDRIIKALGGYNNAFTSIEYTGYYVALPAGNFDKAFDVLLDAIREPNFDPREIDLEREVVREEINRKQDNPTGALYEKFQNLIFAGSVYAPPVLGTTASVGGIDHEAFKTYLHSFYLPNNLCLIVAGDFDRKAVEAQIRKSVADWQPDPNAPLKPIAAVVPARTQVSSEQVTKDVNQVYGIIGYQYPGYQNEDSNLALDMASTLLAGGRSSRLFKRLYIQENLVQSVSVWVWPQEKSGAFGIDYVCPKENVAKVKAIIDEEMQRCITQPWDAGELDKVKSNLIANFEMGLETANDVARSIGEAWIYNRVPKLAAYPADVQAMTEARMKAALAATVRAGTQVDLQVVPKR